MFQERPPLQRILRLLAPLVVVLVVAVGLAACGGGGGDSASKSTDVDTLLDKTFSGDKEVKSGKVELALNVNASGGDSGLSGPVDIKLSGPFESQGDKKLPKFDLDLDVKAQGQSFKAGVESTGDKGFVNFNGQEYVVSDQVFQQFKQGFEQAAAQGDKGSKDQSLTDLGIDPRKWLTDAKNAGEGKVGDTDVIRITGGVDVSKLLDDVNQALAKAGSLGLSNQQIPSRLTDEQKQEVEKALKDVKVEIDTGKDDTILRRVKVDLNAQDPNSDQKLTLSFDLQLLDVNEGQDFSEPDNAKPFDQLLQQFGGLGGLGGALGGAPGSGSGSGSGSSGSSGGASQKKLEEYSKCLQDAGQDVAKAQKCADLLAG
jgi:hypothetical protein